MNFYNQMWFILLIVSHGWLSKVRGSQRNDDGREVSKTPYSGHDM